jgi:hypothetical protein
MASSVGQLPHSPDAGTRADELEVQFGVVKLDYERTLGLLDGVSRTRTTMRAAGVTVYLGFLSLAVERESWILAVAAGVVALLFAANDAHLHWLYHEGLRRSNSLERLLQHRVRALDRRYDPYPMKRLRADLERYQFGALGNLPRASVRRVLRTVSRTAVVLYTLPVVGAVAAALVV